MAGEIALRPSYWASVSGGKDSLYMLNYILHNLDRYPLDGVVHFELEIDYPFIHDVIDYMESECNMGGMVLQHKPENGTLLRFPDTDCEVVQQRLQVGRKAAALRVVELHRVLCCALHRLLCGRRTPF